MRKITLQLFLLLCTAVLPVSLSGQNTQRLEVPLSEPGKPGHLKVGVLYGSITVNTHSGNEVIIETKSKQKQASVSKNGLRKIGGGGGGYSVEEYNNQVTVKSGGTNKKMDFFITVPKNFSLKLNAVNNGNIFVNGVNGDLEISNTNGAITLENVSGSVIADALNRDVVVTFSKVDRNAPMAFTSLNGDLDITFPADFAANIKARTENGDIFTDFEMDQRTSAQVDQNRDSKGVYKVKVNKWVLGEINGGGPEILFKTLNGNILIKSK
ncbi:MAG: DUF4097 family beta strand repeat protein [Flavobacteriaceae bacterium]|nr:DUF4097 family beta strand repeat protein [Flavobacteriaceae bacterium]